MKTNLLIFALCSLIAYGCNSKPDSDSNATTEKPAQVKVDNESANETFCYIKQIFDNENKHYIAVDFIQFLTGKEAEAEAKKHGREVYDDYEVVNDNPKIRTFLIDDKVDISLIDYTNQIKSMPNQKITDLIKREKSINICKITAINGTVTKIEEIYTP